MFAKTDCREMTKCAIIRRDNGCKRCIRGALVMNENSKPIQRLDLDKLKGRITKAISLEEALKDIEPMEWPEEVLSGKQKIIIARRK